MTPSELETLARNRFNATGDTFFDSTELYKFTYELCLEASIEAECIRAYATGTTVASQREYSVPTRALRIISVYVDDEPLDEISLKKAEDLSLLDSADEGTPTQFWLWVDSSGNRKIALDPIPDTAGQTIKFYYEQYSADVSSSIPIPEQYHGYLVDGLLGYMYGKDQNQQMAAFYLARWENNIQKMRTAEMVSRKVGNRYRCVRDVEGSTDYWEQ